MCLVIAVILGFVSFNAFATGQSITAWSTAAGAVFFGALMVRNVRHTARLKKEGKNS